MRASPLTLTFIWSASGQHCAVPEVDPGCVATKVAAPPDPDHGHRGADRVASSVAVNNL